MVPVVGSVMPDVVLLLMLNVCGCSPGGDAAVSGEIDATRARNGSDSAALVVATAGCDSVVNENTITDSERSNGANDVARASRPSDC